MSTASPKTKIAKRRKIPSRRVVKSITKSSPERETVEQSENNNATPQSADEHESVEAVLQKEQDVTLNEITDAEFESEGIRVTVHASEDEFDYSEGENSMSEEGSDIYDSDNESQVVISKNS